LLLQSDIVAKLWHRRNTAAPVHCAINPLCFQKRGVFGGSTENAIHEVVFHFHFFFEVVFHFILFLGRLHIIFILRIISFVIYIMVQNICQESLPKSVRIMVREKKEKKEKIPQN
jgi:hypothetical protein